MSRKGNQLYSFRRCDVIFWLSASKLDKLISYNIVASLWIDNTRIWERYAQSQRAHLARPFPIWELTRYIHSISQSKRNAHKCKKKKIQLWNCAPLLKTDTGFDILHLEELFCERHLFSIYCSDFCQKTSRKTHVPKNWLFLNLRPSNCSNTSLSVWTTPTYKTHNVCTSVNATVTSLTNLNCATSLWIFSAHIKILLFHNIMI